jgi:hypothetical protein
MKGWWARGLFAVCCGATMVVVRDVKSSTEVEANKLVDVVIVVEVIVLDLRDC